ncbi:cysteine hydrolase family protein [Pseudooceanicola sp. 502str34]
MADLPRRDDPFRPGETGLLLVDMQRIWLDEAHSDHGAGGGPAEEFYRTTREVTVPKCEQLIQAARAAGVEVMHTIIQSLTEDGRDRSLDHKMTPIHLAKSDERGLPIPSLMPVGDEILLPKTSSGVFNSTHIDYILKNIGIRQLIVCGIMTDQCVDMAVRDAADRGYMVSVATDACFAANSQRHATALDAFGGYCWQADTDTICDRLARMGDA